LLRQFENLKISGLTFNLIFGHEKKNFFLLLGSSAWHFFNFDDHSDDDDSEMSMVPYGCPVEVLAVAAGWISIQADWLNKK